MKRGNQDEGCRRPLRQFLASLLLRLMPPPSTPSPADHHSPNRTRTKREGRAGAMSRLWVMLSPPPRHRSTIQGRGAWRGLSVILPPLACVLLPAASFRLLRSPLFVLISSARSCLTFCPPYCQPLPLCQVVRGRAGHQPGQAIPSRSSCRPSPPCRGAVRTFRTYPGRGAGGCQP